MSIDSQLDEAFEVDSSGEAGPLGFDQTASFSVQGNKVIVSDKLRDKWEQEGYSPKVRISPADISKMKLRPGKLVKSNKFYEMFLNRDAIDENPGDDPDFSGHVWFNHVVVFPSKWLFELPDRANKIVPDSIPGAAESLPDTDVFSDEHDDLINICRRWNVWPMKDIAMAEKAFAEWSSVIWSDLGRILSDESALE